MNGKLKIAQLRALNTNRLILQLYNPRNRVKATKAVIERASMDDRNYTAITWLLAGGIKAGKTDADRYPDCEKVILPGVVAMRQCLTIIKEKKNA